MQKLLLIILIVALLLSPRVVLAQSEVPIIETTKKLIYTDWIKDKTLKYGYLYSLCGTQFLTGVTEGYHFNGNTGFLATENNYHVYATANRMGWITTGFFAQANLRDKKQSWFHKARRLTGGILISRIFFEGAYRWQRYNNPFCNDPDKNEHAIVYFGIRDGHITDLYIGTGKITTPLADLLILLTGIWIFE